MSELPWMELAGRLELANLVVNSGILQCSWDAIEKLHKTDNLYQEPSLPLSVKSDIDQQSSLTVVSFATSPFCTEEDYLQGKGELVSSEDLRRENFTHFDFLLSKSNPFFSISRHAVELFKAHYDKLCVLKSEIYDSQNARLSRDTPLIIAGHSLGGSVASLFTLWLLDSINQIPKKNVPAPMLPLCITFGSPLLGDKGFQKGILERRKWNACYLHVAGNKDPYPRHFVSIQGHQAGASTSEAVHYKPIGTFFLCSELGCACVEDPEVVSKLLKSTQSQVGNGVSRMDYYKRLVDHLKPGFLIRGNSQLGSSVTTASKALQQPLNMDIDTLINGLGKLEIEQKETLNDRGKAVEQNKKLNEVKVKMAFLEWYKKDCNMRLIGYYDSYKNRFATKDNDVTRYKKFLTNYWKATVENAERLPHNEKARIRFTWLYAGTNYRRMVEPLDIAEFYRDNAQGDYIAEKRSRHYILLEQWQREDSESSTSAGTGNEPNQPKESKKKNVANLLTEDSCFWARVEKARLSCELLRGENTSTIVKESLTEDLNQFEKYVMDQINKYAVNPEIFLTKSSFMDWWRQFQEIMGTSHNSPLVQFMRDGGPDEYKNGTFST
ncbi:hypothetical protein Tsubulata_013618 [Turnera subulata]|uniref:Fungal lipase-like domain-containing protein n=1 Tax=Turnera subulata TaxID=218843 RepID=A0A9Q0F7I4_9ROSI|nr:hypothetical protein Tsubulata_013618 [Turnera subulata]